MYHSVRDIDLGVTLVACLHCGHVNQEGSRYCSSCGRPVTLQEDETTSSFIQLDLVSDTGDEKYLQALSEVPKGSAALVVKSGVGTGSWFVLEREITTIGRHPESNVFLDDITVSRRHAEIRKTGDHYELKDTGSLNGSYLNRERVELASLNHGDELQIGKYRFTYICFTGEQE